MFYIFNLSQLLLPDLSVLCVEFLLFSDFFIAVCLEKKKSRVKECGQEYIRCLSGVFLMCRAMHPSQLCPSSLLIRVVGCCWPKPNLLLANKGVICQHCICWTSSEPIRDCP